MRVVKHKTTTQTTYATVATHGSRFNHFDRKDYITVNAQQLQLCRSMYFKSPTLQSIVNIVINNVVGGGVLIDIKGYKTDDARKQFHNRVWKDWVTDVLFDLLCYGFSVSVIIPHPKYIGIPRVLKLAFGQVYFKDDIYGQRKYVVVDQSFIGREPFAYRSDFNFGGDPVPDTIVFEMNPPDENGNLLSKFMTALGPLFHYYNTINTNRQILQRNLMTEVITEKPKHKNTPEDISLALPNEPLDRVCDTMTPIQVHTSELVNDMRTVQLADALNKGANRSTIANSILGSGDITTESHGHLTLINLPDERVARMQLQRAHHPSIEEERISMETQVGTVFGVPRSMFEPTGKDRVASAGNNRAIFEESQRSTKLLIIPMITSMFVKVHYKLFTRSAIANALASVFLDTNVPDEESNKPLVDVSLPGIPEQQDVERLYCTGYLKREAAIAYTSARLGIPLACFEEKEVITRQELLGIKEEKAEGAAGPQSQTQSTQQKQVKKTVKRGDTSVTTTTTSSEALKEPVAQVKGPAAKKQKTKS
jgi:hypothetical protein